MLAKTTLPAAASAFADIAPKPLDAPVTSTIFPILDTFKA
jgi:hypothetical protein